MARSEWLSCLYYTLFSSVFRREQRACLAGRVRYAEQVAAPRGSTALLRRNVHRLEKGLLMRPRRDVFALDYIGETLDCYRELLPAGVLACTEEMQWAHDVLATYFRVTASHPRLDPLRETFGRLPAPAGSRGDEHVPYRRDLSSPPPVAFEALEALAVRRRSVRWFLPRRVPRQLIEQAVSVAAQSPSACNRQPFVFHVFDDPVLARRVTAIPGGMAGYEDNVPAVVVVVGRLRCYFAERDRHLIYIDASLAAMGFVYALETLGLGSCCANWPDVPQREREMASLLHLEPDERPVMLIALGYPDPEGMVACSRKKPLSELAQFNFE